MAKNANKPSGAETGGKEKKAKAKTTAVTMAEKRAQQRFLIVLQIPAADEPSVHGPDAAATPVFRDDGVRT